MMKVMNFKKGIVKSGKKVVNEGTAQIYASSTYNGFKLNNKALTMLGLVDGDRVVMLDMFDVDDPCTQEDRFYICAADGWMTGDFDKNGDAIPQGAKVSNRSFHYSQLWGSIMANDADVQAVSFDALVAVDKAAYIGKDGAGKSALNTVTAELVPIQEGEEIEVGDNVFRKLFKLAEITFKAHTPRTFEDTTDVDVDVDVENVEE